MVRYFLILSAFILSVSACRKPTDEPGLGSIIKQNSWYVTLMKENGTNYTNAYKGWKFIFVTDTTLIVTNSTDSYNGIWKEDKVRDKFILYIPSFEPSLMRICMEWDIELKTPGRIIFKDDKFYPTMELQLSKF